MGFEGRASGGAELGPTPPTTRANDPSPPPIRLAHLKIVEYIFAECYFSELFAG
jgi:hypothetical protein